MPSSGPAPASWRRAAAVIAWTASSGMRDRQARACRTDAGEARATTVEELADDICLLALELGAFGCQRPGTDAGPRRRGRQRERMT